MIAWISVLVVTLMLGAAVLVLLFDNLIAAIAASSVVSLLLSLLYVLLAAPDVALTEAAVGAGLSGAVLALGLRRLGLINLNKGESDAVVRLPAPSRRAGRPAHGTGGTFAAGRNADDHRSREPRSRTG